MPNAAHELLEPLDLTFGAAGCAAEEKDDDLSIAIDHEARVTIANNEAVLELTAQQAGKLAYFLNMTERLWRA